MIDNIISLTDPLFIKVERIWKSPLSLKALFLLNRYIPSIAIGLPSSKVFHGRALLVICPILCLLILTGAPAVRLDVFSATLFL